jgi:hypothetical protein
MKDILNLHYYIITKSRGVVNMPKKNINLEWYVFRHDFNAKKIEKYNVFSHSGFLKDVTKLPKDKNVFIEQLRRNAMYYFGSKCEMEVIITSWPAYIDMPEYDRITKEIDHIRNDGRTPRVVNIAPTVGSKIDIYEQLMLNWDAFVNYTYNAIFCK